MFYFKGKKKDCFSFSSSSRIQNQPPQFNSAFNRNTGLSQTNSFSQSSSYPGKTDSRSSFFGNQSRSFSAGSFSHSRGAFSASRASDTFHDSTSTATFSRTHTVKLRRLPISLFAILLFCGMIFASLYSRATRLDDPTTTVSTIVPSPSLRASNSAGVISGDSFLLTSQAKNVPRFYYSQLLPNEQTVYESIRTGLGARFDSIKFGGCTKDMINKVYALVCLDYPEYFWCDHSYRIEQVGMGSSASFALYPGYYYSAAETQRCNTEFEAAAQQAIAPLLGKSDYEKALGVYEYIIDHTIYDFDYSSFSAYQILKNGRGVCSGYSALTQVLLNKLGIECFIISGYAENSMWADDHAWNMAKLDGSWYLIDTTWGDPVSSDGSQTINYKYFCLTSSEMNRSHQPDSGFDYPLCTATTCNYYVHEGLFLPTYSREALRRIRDTALQKRANIEFRCADRDVYAEAIRDLFDEHYCWELLEGANPGIINPKSLSHAIDENFLIIRFFLEYY